MNLSATLAKAIKKSVFAKQKDSAEDLVGKNVVRNGTTFLVVDVSKEKDKIIVSATGTQLEQVITFKLKSFLSKKITVIEDEKV